MSHLGCLFNDILSTFLLHNLMHKKVYITLFDIDISHLLSPHFPLFFNKNSFLFFVLEELLFQLANFGFQV